MKSLRKQGKNLITQDIYDEAVSKEVIARAPRFEDKLANDLRE